MAIAYRAGNSGGNSSGTDVTVTKPTGTVDYDILLAVTYREAGAWTLPSGWAWVNTGTPEQANRTNNGWVGLAWKRASGEGASWTFQLSTTTWRMVTVGAWSGCKTSGNPWDVYTSNYAHDDTENVVIADSITTTVADTMRVVGAASYSGVDITVASSGMTQRAELGGCELFEQAQAAAGASGTEQLGNVNMTNWAAWHVALAPDTGETPPVNTPVAVEFVGQTSNSATTATTNCVLDKPANVKANDVLIASLVIEVAAPTVSPPDSTWTLCASGTPSGTSRALRLLTYSKILTAADEATSSWTWTVTTGYEWAGICCAYRNCIKPTTGSISTANNQNAGAIAPAVTTVRTNAMVVSSVCNARGATWTASASPAFNERADVRSGTGTANVSVEISDSIFAAAGGTGNITTTASAGDYWVAGLVALEVVAFERAMLQRRLPQTIDVWRN